jgi:hypothetical protein
VEETNPETLRLTATIYLKNSVKAFWNRHGALGADADAEQERSIIKSTLLARYFTEPLNSMALQISHTVSLIATTDFPRHWPELFPSIFEALGSAAAEVETNFTRSLFLGQRCFELIAEALERRSAIHRDQVVRLLTGFIDQVHAHWGTYINALMQAIAALQTPGAEEFAFLTAAQTARVCRHAMRALAAFVVDCGQHVCTSELGQAIFPAVANVMTSLTKFQAELPVITATHALRTDLRDLRAHAAAMVQQTQAQNAVQFAPFLGPFLALFRAMIEQRAAVRVARLTALTEAMAEGDFRTVFSADEDEDEGDGAGKGSDGCTMQAFTFLTSVLLSGVYRGSLVGSAVGLGGGMQFAHEAAANAQAVMQAFFDEATITALAQTVVTSFMPWSRHDLTEWCSSPEEFFEEHRYRRQDTDERAAAAALIYQLSSSHPEVVARVLMQALSAAAAEEVALGGPREGITPAGEKAPAVVYMHRLRKDGVLRAIGTCIFLVQEHFDREALAAHILSSAEAVLTAVEGFGAVSFATVPSAALALYRSVWLAGELTEVNLDQAMLATLFGLVNAAMGAPDEFVALGASLTARVLIESGSLPPSVFEQPVAGTTETLMTSCFQLLLGLCVRCRAVEAQTHALAVTSELVKAVGPAIERSVPVLVDALPKLWNSAEGHAPIKLRIVSTMSELAVALGRRSEELQTFFIQVTVACIDTNSPDHVALFEMGLELWHNIVSNAVRPSEELLELFSYWLTYYAEYEDHFDVAVEIFESYIVLYGDALLEKFGAQLGVQLLALAERLGDGMLSVLGSIIAFTALRCPRLFVPSFGAVMYYMLQQLDLCISHGTGAEEVIEGVTLGKFAVTFAHLMVRCPEALTAALAEMEPCPHAAANGLSPLDQIVTALIELEDDIPAGYPRRIRAMALAAALALPGSQTMLRAANVIAICAAEVAEQSGEDEIPSQDGLDQIEEPEVYRLAMINAEDMSNQITLRDYVISQFHRCAEVHGSAALHEALGSLDPAVIAPLGLDSN